MRARPLVRQVRRALCCTGYTLVVAKPDSRVQMGRKDRREIIDFDVVLDPEDRPAVAPSVQEPTPKRQRLGWVGRAITGLRSSEGDQVTVPATSVGQPLPQIVKIRVPARQPQIRRVVVGTQVSRKPRNHRHR